MRITAVFKYLLGYYSCVGLDIPWEDVVLLQENRSDGGQFEQSRLFDQVFTEKIVELYLVKPVTQVSEGLGRIPLLPYGIRA